MALNQLSGLSLASKAEVADLEDIDVSAANGSFRRARRPSGELVEIVLINLILVFFSGEFLTGLEKSWLRCGRQVTPASIFRSVKKDFRDPYVEG